MGDDGNPIARVIAITLVLITFAACRNYIPSYDNPFDPESPIYAATTPPTIVGPNDGFEFNAGFTVKWKKAGTVADVYRLQVAAERDFRAGSVVLDVELQGVDTFTVPSLAFNGPVYCRLALKLNQNGIVWSPWSAIIRLIKLASTGNRAPTVSLTPPSTVSVKGGAVVVFDAVGDDADGDVLIYRWYVDGTEQSVRTASFKFNTPILAVDKTYTIAVAVSDGVAASAPASADIVVYSAALFYAVSYDGNGADGGGLPASAEFVFGQSVIVSAPGGLARTGHRFAGWNTAANGGGKPYAAGDSFAMPPDGVVLYAQWTKNNYGILYVGNGADGGQTPAAESHAFGSTVPLATAGTMTRTGFSFTGWHTSQNWSGPPMAAGSAFTVSDSDVTLYAQWAINSYSLTYNGNGSDGGAPPSAASYEYGAAATIAAAGTLARTGFSFTGWNTVADGTGTPYAAAAGLAMPAGDIRLYAQWSVSKYTLSYDSNGADGGTAPAPSEYEYGASATAAAAGTFARSGYSFAGWNTAADGGGTGQAAGGVFAMPAASIRLYAQWMPNANTVNFNANGGDGSMANQTIATGASAALSDNAFTRTGYAFAGWNTQAGGGGDDYANGANYTMGTASVVLYAQWSASVYTLSYNGNDADGGAVPPTVSYAYETSVTIATAGTMTRIGYTFAGWNTAANGTGTAYSEGAGLSMPAWTLTLYAQWTANYYAVAFNANGGDGSMANQSIAYGGSAALTANAFTRAGYEFAGWNTISGGGGTSYGDGAVYPMDGTTTATLYAQWLVMAFTLRYDGNGADSGAPPAAIGHNSGSTVTVSGAASLSRTGYVFAGWNTLAGGAGASYAAGDSLTMPASSLTLYARWLPANALSVTIEIADGDNIAFMADGSVPRGAMLSASVNQLYSAYEWWVDGDLTALGGQSVEIPTAALSLGLHSFMVVVTNAGGGRSSAACYFYVVN